VFYGKPITFTFTVDKGTIKFPENPPFRFEFKSTVEAVKVPPVKTAPVL
jgi:hypothetical protein